MHCNAGELARVSDPDSMSYGVITRVLRVHPPGHGMWVERLGPIWEVEGELSAVMSSFFGEQIVIRTNLFPDSGLRPIRDPGEDAKDETLSWKPLPLPEIIPAMLDRETA